MTAKRIENNLVRIVTLKAFDDFKGEGFIIGKLLAGYGQIEIDLMNCAAVACQDFNRVLKDMFRHRSETKRIRNASSIGQFHYKKTGLDAEFTDAISMVEHCLKIRNMYAHCQWYNDHSSELAFVNLEDIARGSSLVVNLHATRVHHVNLAFLATQEAFYQATGDFLTWINYEGRYRDGRLSSHMFAKPAATAQPPLHKP